MKNSADYWYNSLQWNDRCDIVATLNRQVLAGYASLNWKNGHGISITYDDGSILSSNKKSYLYNRLKY